jgi:ferrochelatase
MRGQSEAVFFISFGGPEKREDIRPFLEIVTRGRRIPPERIDEVAHHYEKIGGASPINAITRRQAEALQKLLNAECGARSVEEGSAPHSALPVYVGNRNWHPFLDATLRQMRNAGIRRAIGFPTAAHRTEASWERYLNAVEAAREKVGPDAPEIHYVEPWFDHPLFIDAICARVREILNGNSIPHPLPLPSRERAGGEGWSWVFTAHSIPTSMAAASRYVQELTRTAELVAGKFGVKEWRLAYTSRSGAPTDSWLEPDVCDLICELARTGVRDVLAVPIGFVTDHVEVLFDLDIEARAAAEKAGMRLHRAPTVGDHPLFIQMIADLIKKTASPLPIPSPTGRR